MNFKGIQEGLTPRYLLGMHSIYCPIDPYGGPQKVQPSVFTNAVGDGCQGGSTEMSRTFADGLTDKSDHMEIHRTRFQTQLSQNLTGVFQTAVWPG